MPPKQKGLSLVLVDDDAALLNALTFAFETEGYEVRAYRDGATLLNAAPVARDACLVVDEKLGNESGMELLARLRTQGMNAPAILITTHPTAGILRRAAAAGVEVVEKPLLGNILSGKVREAIERVQAL